MSDTHRETDRGPSQEAKTPQAVASQTRTVSTEVSMENAFLDKRLSKIKYWQERILIAYEQMKKFNHEN